MYMHMYNLILKKKDEMWPKIFSFKFSLNHKNQFYYIWIELMKEKKDNNKQTKISNNHDVNAIDKLLEN